MRAEEISIKTKMIYAAAVCLILVFLWLGNEGSSPLIYLGSELQHSVGLIDSQYSLVIQESVAMNGIVANTPKYVLNRGSYTVWLNYTAQEADSVLELWEQGRKLAAWTIDPSKTHITADFTLTSERKRSVDDQRIEFSAADHVLHGYAVYDGGVPDRKCGGVAFLFRKDSPADAGTDRGLQHHFGCGAACLDADDADLSL